MTDLPLGATSSFPEALAEAASLTDRVLDKLLEVPDGPEARVFEAMRYSALAPGKRLRPFLVLASAQLFSVGRRSALQAAAAVELVHAYSLVHDDLPAMDNSDLRRGRPTCHKQFDDATAVLAGDALQGLAFEVLAQPDTHGDPAVRCELVTALANGGRRPRHGRRPDARPPGREGPDARYRRHHPAAAPEDRRADRLLLRGRGDSRQGGARGAAGAARLCP